ncbi:hypothetical protein WJX72_000137 [[Myrmecia] bisecta]|uniref:Uncharacterized protein n=1 Tax=[Myrmecia] bisecta TaxID=41462 RepID=A0AAW1PJ45_9CHLO
MRHSQGLCRAANKGSEEVPAPTPQLTALLRKEGPSTDFAVIWQRLWKLAWPYWTDNDDARSAQIKLAGVMALTLGTTGVSVLFNFLGRDFFNALSEKDADKFAEMIVKWLIALCGGIPVFVMRDFFQNRLALDWREYMTRQITEDYFANRTFYQVQAGSLVDNPDQRIASDIRTFTDTALGFSMTILNAVVDLVSFSGILYTIYPPLFLALLIYSVGGTGISLYLGRPLIGLNFQQEAQEANYRYGLVRVRENAESIAFYGGEKSEERLLGARLTAVISNYAQLITTERNLQFFTSFYRFLIQILPAAVVAPLYFQGKIEFGVINQSSSAFNHILSDVSLVVYQFEALAGFGAVIDRLGEFAEVLDVSSSSEALGSQDEAEDLITLEDCPAPAATSGQDAVLLEMDNVTLRTPNGATTLVEGLSLQVAEGNSLLIVGSSGAGKTSILRAAAGLWNTGQGTIRRYGQPIGAHGSSGDIFFLPQRPYVVLGSLRDQLLYPTWGQATEPLPKEQSVPDSNGNGSASESQASSSASSSNGSGVEGPRHQGRALPSDKQLREVLVRVRLGALLERNSKAEASGNGLDTVADWAGVLSLGEQQRLAFARVLLARPRLVLMDESTSALDTSNEALLYAALRQDGITYISVGHRPTLRDFHQTVLRLKTSAGDNATDWEFCLASDVPASALS